MKNDLLITDVIKNLDEVILKFDAYFAMKNLNKKINFKV